MKHLIATSLVLLFASPAFAATIDFGDSEWAAAEGEQSYTTEVDGVGVTVTADPADLGATIEHTGRGLGVDFEDGRRDSRQIEGEEVLTVQFDELVDVTELSVTRFYDWGIIRIEVGSYTIDGESHEFEAETWNGRLTVPVDAEPTDTIVFRAVGGWSLFGGENGFSLETLSFEPAAVTSVPELDPNAMPAAVALVAGGAVVLAERRRSRA